jgi:hypothetical protein
MFQGIFDLLYEVHNLNEYDAVTDLGVKIKEIKKGMIQ